MTTAQLLDIYYKGLANKSGWETVISDDFKFVGGDMTNVQEPTVGKNAYSRDRTILQSLHHHACKIDFDF